MQYVLSTQTDIFREFREGQINPPELETAGCTVKAPVWGREQFIWDSLKFRLEGKCWLLYQDSIWGIPAWKKILIGGFIKKVSSSIQITRKHSPLLHYQQNPRHPHMFTCRKTNEETHKHTRNGCFKRKSYDMVKKCNYTAPSQECNYILLLKW